MLRNTSKKIELNPPSSLLAKARQNCDGQTDIGKRLDVEAIAAEELGHEVLNFFEMTNVCLFELLGRQNCTLLHHTFTVSLTKFEPYGY